MIVGATFVAVGIPKLEGEAKVAANFERWGYPETIRTAVGAVELLAGARSSSGSPSSRSPWRARWS